MKIAIVYHRESKKVINLLGTLNQERYGKKSITRITAALEQGGHQVATFEGDRDLIDNLEEFMPRVIKGERPGMAFNLAYGIQGQARYTHVPGILEMIGLPYVGSGPMAHSLPHLPYPIVEPRNEAISFGVQIVSDEDELRGPRRAVEG